MGMKKCGMEGVMDFLLGWELDAIGHRANYFCDFEGAKVLSAELHGGMCHFDICPFDPHLLSFLIGAEGHLLVPETLHLGHGFMCIFLCLFHQSFPIFYCWDISFSCRLVGMW
jgi:hypothetical protein